MKRLIFYLLKTLAFISRSLSINLYMKVLMKAHETVGVRFDGKPEYIQADAYLDGSGGLTISEGAVISTKVIILTHDWSFLKRINCPPSTSYNERAYKSVSIGMNSFIGAGAIVLPGSHIGRHCIVGAGAVIKGIIPDYSIVIGNPCKIIGDTRDNRKSSSKNSHTIASHPDNLT